MGQKETYKNLNITSITYCHIYQLIGEHKLRRIDVLGFWFGNGTRFWRLMVHIWGVGTKVLFSKVKTQLFKRNLGHLEKKFEVLRGGQGKES